MIELKPCPFCGNKKLKTTKSPVRDERYGYNFDVYIRCNCGVRISKPSHRVKTGWCDDVGEAEKDVIEAWNTRAIE